MSQLKLFLVSFPEWFLAARVADQRLLRGGNTEVH